MPRMNDTDLNVEKWSRQYDIAVNDDEEYVDVLRTTDDTVRRAKELWHWKGLDRGIDFDDIEPVIQETDFNSLIERTPKKAVEGLSGQLVRHGVIRNPAIVTPAFLLHLADTDADNYSKKFPIFDTRVWAAYSFLTGKVKKTDSLPTTATSSTAKYQNFCYWFQKQSTNYPARTFEKALFRFGSYIQDLPDDTVEDIERRLENRDWW